MSVIVVDFESFFRSRKNKGSIGPKYSLRGMTYEEYLGNDEFNAYMVGIKINRNPAYIITEDIEAHLAELFSTGNQHTLVGHNLMFDGAIFSWLYGLEASRYVCTQALSQAIWPHARHSLDALTQRLNPNLAKGSELGDMDGVKHPTPEQLARIGSYCANDAEITFANLAKMYPHFPEAESDLIDFTLRCFLHPTLNLDRDRVSRFMAKTELHNQDLIKAAGVGRTTLASPSKFATWLDHKHGIVVPLKPSPTIKDPSNTCLALAKDDLEFIELQAEYPELKAVWEARKACASNIAISRSERLLTHTEGGGPTQGRLAIPLKYYGATTGRWSGSNSVNMQNFPRGGELRKSILAPPGYQIVVADLSNIESRMIAWWAGCTELLDNYRNGEDVYSIFASSVYGYPVDRKKKAQDALGNYLDADGTIVDKDDAHVPHFEQGFLGKTAILGLSYGTGHDKLRTTLQVQGGIQITENQAFDIVRNKYRARYKEIPNLWREGERMIQHMASAKEGELPMKWGPCEVSRRRIKLPNGLYLQYPELRYDNNTGDAADGGEWSYWNGKHREKLYGAKVCQAVTQSLARIVMSEALIDINYKLRKYFDSRLVLTVHDELVAISPEQNAPRVLDCMIGRLRQAPVWTDNSLTLDAEGGFAQNYSK